MEFLKEIKSTLLIMAGFYIIIGLVMAIAPVFVSNSICYLTGSLCIIIGGLAIYTYIQSEVYGPLGMATLIMAIVFIGLGIFIIMNPETIASFIPMVMGIILVVDALTKMQTAARLKKYGYNKWWQTLVLALVVALFGVLLLINPFKSLTLFIRVLGIFLIVNGIADDLSVFSYSKIEKTINR